MKGVIKILAGVTVLACLATLFIRPCAASEKTFIDNSAYTAPTQYKVEFEHDSHNEKAGISDCIYCHHLYENGKRVEDETSEDMPCSDCHSPALFDRQLTLTTAFHRNCKGCHLKEQKGPVMCGECHTRH